MHSALYDFSVSSRRSDSPTRVRFTPQGRYGSRFYSARMASFVYKCNDAACKSCATLVVRKMDCVTRCMEHVQTHFPSRPLIKSDWGLLTASISLDTTRQSGSVDWTMSKSMNVVQCPGENKISHMLRKTDLAESE
jgi:hypothetical protein